MRLPIPSRHPALHRATRPPFPSVRAPPRSNPSAQNPFPSQPPPRPSPAPSTPRSAPWPRPWQTPPQPHFCANSTSRRAPASATPRAAVRPFPTPRRSLHPGCIPPQTAGFCRASNRSRPCAPSPRAPDPPPRKTSSASPQAPAPFPQARRIRSYGLSRRFWSFRPAPPRPAPPCPAAR